MRQHLLPLCFPLFACVTLSAQSGCPGCIVGLPPNLPEDTVYLSVLSDGLEGTPYNRDISFRMPKTVPPGMDPWPPGLPINSVEIVGIGDLPPGLLWEANQKIFPTTTVTDGCVKICGAPLTSGLFDVAVNLKVTISPFVFPVSFTTSLYIAAPFALTDSVGCGSTTALFTNNIPSNGTPGFSYEWEFGDGAAFNGENPPPHTYGEPGIYEVKYKATIDTACHRLAGVEVLTVGCTDLLSSPDLFVKVFAPDGQKMFESTSVDNAPLPHTFSIALPLEPQPGYVLEVWDKDSGIDGINDELCGSLSFNILSGGDTLVAGALRVIPVIEKPIETVFDTQTVTVHPLPLTPVIDANTLLSCFDEPIVLASSYSAGNQWLTSGDTIPGATDSLFSPDKSGSYQVQVTNAHGCTAVSEEVTVEYVSFPVADFTIVDIDSLTVTLNNLSQHGNSNTWFFGDGQTLSTNDSLVKHTYDTLGTYIIQLIVKNECGPSTIEVPVPVGIVSAQIPAWLRTLRLYPNPNNGIFTLEMGGTRTGEIEFSLCRPDGRLVRRQTAEPDGKGMLTHTFNFSDLPPALYLLHIWAEAGATVVKVLVQR